MRPEIGVVHLGIGAFWRAFGVPWVEDVVAASGGDWGVLGVSLRSASVRDALAADCSYHALERGAEVSVRKIGALRKVLVAPEDPEAVMAAMARPEVSLVTLTVTEKGYCYTPATGALDLAHPGIIHELANPEAPETAPGFIVAALARRRQAGLAPFTCLSCDNLPENGRVLRQVVLDLARRIDPGLANWIEAEGAFPCSMVDRIVPATTAADIDEAERLTGARDTGLVVHEPFRQWVIEDRFCTARPAFESAGVQVVPDVAPFEHMKLRCLNGTHSALAYLGVLGGKETVSAAVADAGYALFIQGMWAEEIVPSFTPPTDMNTELYTKALMARYHNPGIQHRTIQIAMDGSQKLPQRILATMADNLASGQPVARLGLAVAAWLHFLRGENGPVNDPLSAPLQAAARGGDPVADVLAIDAVFDPVLVADARFVGAITEGYKMLAEAPVGKVLEGWR